MTVACQTPTPDAECERAAARRMIAQCLLTMSDATVARSLNALAQSPHHNDRLTAQLFARLRGMAMILPVADTLSIDTSSDHHNRGAVMTIAPLFPRRTAERQLRRATEWAAHTSPVIDNLLSHADGPLRPGYDAQGKLICLCAATAGGGCVTVALMQGQDYLICTLRTATSGQGHTTVLDIRLTIRLPAGLITGSETGRAAANAHAAPTEQGGQHA